MILIAAVLRFVRCLILVFMTLWTTEQLALSNTRLFICRERVFINIRLFIVDVHNLMFLLKYMCLVLHGKREPMAAWYAGCPKWTQKPETTCMNLRQEIDMHSTRVLHRNRTCD